MDFKEADIVAMGNLRPMDHVGPSSLGDKALRHMLLRPCIGWLVHYLQQQPRKKTVVRSVEDIYLNTNGIVYVYVEHHDGTGLTDGWKNIGDFSDVPEVFQLIQFIYIGQPTTKIGRRLHIVTNFGIRPVDDKELLTLTRSSDRFQDYFTPATTDTMFAAYSTTNKLFGLPALEEQRDCMSLQSLDNISKMDGQHVRISKNECNGESLRFREFTTDKVYLCVVHSKVSKKHVFVVSTHHGQTVLYDPSLPYAVDFSDAAMAWVHQWSKVYLMTMTTINRNKRKRH